MSHRTIRRLSVIALIAATSPLLAGALRRPNPTSIASRGPTAEPIPMARRAETPSEQFLADRFVVKFKPDLTECAHDLFASGRRFSSALTDHSNSLDRLNRKFAVRSVRPLFARRCGESAAQARKREARRAGEIRRKFAQRAERARGKGLPDLTSIYVFEVPDGSDIREICRLYAADPHVEYATPDYIAQTAFQPNDPYYSSSGSWGQPYDDLWGLKRIQAGAGWDLSMGLGTVIAVVDTGLDYLHEDIAANVWMNAGEIAGNGVDDDANGFIDDVRGWDATTCDQFVLLATGSECAAPKLPDADPFDDNGHGTHVAGIAAAVGDNGLGIIGVAPQAEIMPVRGLNVQGIGVTSDLVQAIVYAADNGADVINASWGGLGTNPAIEDAIAYTDGLGAIFVAAAGNDFVKDALRFYPANIRPAVVASALGPSGTLPIFSNVGANVDFAAPGVDVLSLRAAGTDMYGDGSRIVGEKYYRADGTSMAAPHVAGLVANVLSRNPTWSKEQVVDAARRSSDDIGNPGWDISSGYGVINAFAAPTAGPGPLGRIASPRRGSVLWNAGRIAIDGTASGSGFQSYSLGFRLLRGFSWQPLAGPLTIPVQGGELAEWDTSPLPDGLYHIRLIVTDSGGRTSTDITEAVVVNAPTTKPGWPIQIPERVGPTSPVIGDLDRNGMSEIIVTSDSKLHLYTSSGSPLWNRSFNGPISGASLADLDRDGTLEIILLEGLQTGAILHVLRHDGNPQAGWPRTTPNPYDYPPLAMPIADLDGNGTLEILIPQPFDKLYVYSATGQLIGSYLEDLNGDCAVGDVTGDGRPEVIVGTACASETCSNPNRRLHALTYDGSSLVGLGGNWPVTLQTEADPYSFGPSERGAVLSDLERDGIADIVVPTHGKLRVYRPDGLPKTGWPRELETVDAVGHLALGDLDGDGDLEIVLPTYSSGVYVFQHDGAFQKLPSALGEAYEASAVIADLDGDRDGEILVSPISWLHITFSEGISHAYAFDFDRSSKQWQPVWSSGVPTVSGFEDVYYTAPVIRDLDGNGALDLLVISPVYTSTHLQVWELPAPGGSGPPARIWPTFGQDERHTNFYIAPATTPGFHTVTPCRLADTRGSVGPLGAPAILGTATRSFPIVGRCGIPPTATAVALNITVTQAQAPGHLAVYPAEIPLPRTSTLNYRAGQTRANNAIVPLGPHGDILATGGQAAGTVDLVLDVTGYFE